MAPNEAEAKKKAARETIDILHEISTLLVRFAKQLNATKERQN
jgi:hypothetical protein